MAYREKLAWVMAIALSLTGYWYFKRIDLFPYPESASSSPNMALLVGYVILVVIASIIGAIIAASSKPSEAEIPLDERERLILDKAGHWSGYILAIIAMSGLIDYGLFNDGNRLFHIVFGSLIASQIAEYVFQIILYRRGI